MDVTFTDLDTNYRLALRNGVLVYVEKPAGAGTSVGISLSKARLLQLLGGDTDSPGIRVTGDASVLGKLMGVLEKGDDNFSIVTP